MQLLLICLRKTACLSSLLLATSVVAKSEAKSANGKIVRGDLVISPYPFGRLHRETLLFIYLEIYNLLLDAEGQSRYEIEYKVKRQKKKGLFARLNPFGKKDESISISDSRFGNSRNEPIFHQLDFSRLSKGTYDLLVKVSDKLAELEEVKMIKIRLM